MLCIMEVFSKIKTNKVQEKESFFETPEVGIIGVFVLLKYENELELVTSDISFTSVSP